MSAKHTPGPWFTDGEEVYARGDASTDFDDIVIGMADGRGSIRRGIYAKPPKKEREANARLISAAPELLEALEKCPLPSTLGSVQDHYQRFYDWYKRVAVPAITKAGGLA